MWRCRWTNESDGSWGLRHPQLSPARGGRPHGVHKDVHSDLGITTLLSFDDSAPSRSSPASAVSACGPRPVRQSAPVRRSASGGRGARPRAARTGPTTPRTPSPTARIQGVEHLAPVFPRAHETGRAQHAQVLGHRGPADVARTPPRARPRTSRAGRASVRGSSGASDPRARRRRLYFVTRASNISSWRIVHPSSNPRSSSPGSSATRSKPWWNSSTSVPPSTGVRRNVMSVGALQPCSSHSCSKVSSRSGRTRARVRRTPTALGCRARRRHR